MSMWKLEFFDRGICQSVSANVDVQPKIQPQNMIAASAISVVGVRPSQDPCMDSVRSVLSPHQAQDDKETACRRQAKLSKSVRL